MAMTHEQMVNILKDAIVTDVNDQLVQTITRPAIPQQQIYPNTYHADKLTSLTSPSNEKLKNEHFSPKDWLLINDVKASVYNTLCALCPIPMRLLETAIVAGGCFASLLHVEKPKDYDIFILKDDVFRNDLYRRLGEYTDETETEWKYNQDSKYLQNPKVDAVFTYEQVVGHHIKIQFIFTKFQSREELINDFDFLHCRTSMTLDPNNLNLFITPATHRAIVNKILMKNPKCNREPSAWRIDKFLERGWHLQAEFGPPGTIWVNGKWVTI